MWGRTSSGGQSSDRLAERRRVRRRRVRIALLVLVLLVCGALVWGLWQSSVRISRVEVFGTEVALASYATEAMQGAYLGIIPRDSIFFFPEDEIRARILSAHSDIAALSIFRSSLTSLSIKVDSRLPIAKWCGLAPTPNVEPYCYVFDSSGLIFAASETATTDTVNPFILYAPLVGDTQEPLLATITNAEKLPTTFDFARQLATLGSPVTHIIIRDGEVNDYLASGTRITYVLGREHDAFTALVSSKESLNLSDGSIDYVDLRFEGKVYLKRMDDTVQ